MKRVQTGINGFGRFGLHLLKYFLDHRETAKFEVCYINDDFLTIDQAFDIINTDRYVDFKKYRVQKSENHLSFAHSDGLDLKIKYSTSTKNNIKWIGSVDLFLECSGKYSNREEATAFLVGNTKHVLISQTSWDCDKTLVYGLNHEEFNPEHKLISYGSCTVNAFSAFTKYVHEQYGVKAADVNVIHNLPGYKLKDPKYYTLVRKFCTLEKSVPNLLDFIGPLNFNVNYTLVPYCGSSIFDYRFELNNPPKSKEEFIENIENACLNGSLKGLHNFVDEDKGPEQHECTKYSSVFVKENINLRGNSVYIHSYFDNENSVNRYFDLINYISVKITK